MWDWRTGPPPPAVGCWPGAGGRPRCPPAWSGGGSVGPPNQCYGTLEPSPHWRKHVDIKIQGFHAVNLYECCKINNLMISYVLLIKSVITYLTSINILKLWMDLTTKLTNNDVKIFFHETKVHVTCWKIYHKFTNKHFYSCL